jgi:hypothetical protein
MTLMNKDMFYAIKKNIFPESGHVIPPILNFSKLYQQCGFFGKKFQNS